MGRFRWIQIEGKLIPADEVTETITPMHMIIPDIQPYRSMADGTIVEGRRQHREMLQRNNCFEIGNEKQTPRPATPPPGLKETLIQVAQEKLRYR